MRVMVDANVLLSAVVFRSANMLHVLEHASSEGNELLVSSWVIDEVRSVTLRKWPKRLASIDALLLAMRYEHVVTPPVDEMEADLFEIRDPMDYPVLYSAVIGDADVFVTGDRDFEDVRIGKPEIMSPAEYVRRYPA